MSPTNKVLVFFREVVKAYSCGDVHSLLSLSAEGKLDKAGPLLACVVNGIDMLGGMMLGFNAPSGPPSVAFMRQHLGLSEELAKLLYALVRCGVSHEGTTKLPIQFFIDEFRPDPGRFLYHDDEGSLWLNVTELAYRYLGAVEQIAADVTAHLYHVPVPSEWDEKVLDAVDLTKFPDLSEYLKAAWPARESAESEKAQRLGTPRSSSSPFLKEHLARFTVPKTSP